jgi:hypothetical protein
VDDFLCSVLFDNIFVEAAKADELIVRNLNIREGDVRCDLRRFFRKLHERPCISLAVHDVKSTIGFLKELCNNNICCGLKELAVSSATPRRKLSKRILQLAKARKENPIERIHIKHFEPYSGLAKNVVADLTKLKVVELVETQARHTVCTTTSLPYHSLTKCFRTCQAVVNAPVPVSVVCGKNHLMSGF